MASGRLSLRSKQLACPRQSRFDEFQLAVLQADLKAAQGTPGRDIATHHAGTDDMDPRCRCRIDNQLLQAFLQEEHPHQIAGCRRHDQPGK